MDVPGMMDISDEPEAHDVTGTAKAVAAAAKESS
jgi:hypothetical protein